MGEPPSGSPTPSEAMVTRGARRRAARPHLPAGSRAAAASARAPGPPSPRASPWSGPRLAAATSHGTHNQ